MAPMSAELFDPAPGQRPEPLTERGEPSIRPTPMAEPAVTPTTSAAASGDRQRPLADRMRPSSLELMVGQAALIGPTGQLRALLESRSNQSLLLWGPPGCGKTTLARLMASQGDARCLEYSAVAVGTKELKAVMDESARLLRTTGQRTILFLDEVHRFNKGQQDALLPWVERGDVQLIGATTENPSFELNAALLSRLRLFVLAPLTPNEVRTLLERALVAPDGLAPRAVHFTPAALDAIAELSEGDARTALGLLDSVSAVVVESRTGMTENQSNGTAAAPITATDLDRLIQHRAVRYDKAGEEHFNLISALHKSLRNSDVQAGIYWLTRMLAGGEDPLYIARRLVRFASEDVGLADPQALPQALAARDAVHFIGLPEGALALAQITAYLALAPKSNALYAAYEAAEREVSRGYNPPVPLQLRNAPTRLMKNIGYGEDYIYAPDTSDGIASMTCLPTELAEHQFYRPSAKGFEAELQRRMDSIAAWHRRRQADAEPTPARREPGGSR